MFPSRWRSVNALHQFAHSTKQCKHMKKCYGMEASKSKDRKVRVCDLSSGISGPYCGMILGDMGAEVIKIENHEGDISREWGPPFIRGESPCYLSANRNKKSISLDIEDKEDREIILKLINKSDVVIENYQPEKMIEWDMSYNKLSKRNKKLIYASISCFGSEGPLSHRSGHHDLLAAAAGGFHSITGLQGGESCVVGVPVIELMAGLYTSSAILAALYERIKNGIGREIKTSLLQVELAFLNHVASNYLNAGAIGVPLGTAHGSIVPYQAMKTSNGMIIIAVTNDKHFNNMCEALDLMHLLHDERFSSNKIRVENRKTVISVIESKLETATSEHWIDRLEKCGVPCTLVESVQSAFGSAQSQALNMVQTLTHSKAGEIKLPGPAINWNREEPPTAPPFLGQHTQDILQNILGYSDRDVTTFFDDRKSRLP